MSANEGPTPTARSASAAAAAAIGELESVSSAGAGDADNASWFLHKSAVRSKGFKIFLHFSPYVLFSLYVLCSTLQ